MYQDTIVLPTINLIYLLSILFSFKLIITDRNYFDVIKCRIDDRLFSLHICISRLWDIATYPRLYRWVAQRLGLLVWYLIRRQKATAANLIALLLLFLFCFCCCYCCCPMLLLWLFKSNNYILSVAQPWIPLYFCSWLGVCSANYPTNIRY